MKRIRSKNLWQYLCDAGLLTASEEDISKAKAEYRREYKKKWKQNRQMPIKDVRLSFTLKQYQGLKNKAGAMNTTPTVLSRDLVLAFIHSNQLVPDKDHVHIILQHLCMGSIALLQERHIDPSIIDHIQTAENLLTEYLDRHAGH